MKKINQFFKAFALIFLGFTNMQASAQIADELSKLLNDSATRNAHVGVSIFDTKANSFITQYNAEKYFVPASNTKLFTMYAGMKYLEDSLVGLVYADYKDSLRILGTGDPTFMHEDFTTQPVQNFLLNATKPMVMYTNNWQAKKYGKGWTWDEYDASYMPERSPLPIYGNLAAVKFQRFTDTNSDTIPYNSIDINPKNIFDTNAVFTQDNLVRNVEFSRDPETNKLMVAFTEKAKSATASIPFITDTAQAFLNWFNGIKPNAISSQLQCPKLAYNRIYSQPTDSLLTPMMHNSDNFFTEQALLMISNQVLGYMNDDSIRSKLLANDFKALPNKPVWADASGLSRYNLFTPNDFVWLLKKMSDEFLQTRIESILATGNTGTLTNYYKGFVGKIFAKTGTLSGQVALSGYLYAASGKRLVFSVLVNNHNSSGPLVRRAVEKYLQTIAAKN